MGNMVHACPHIQACVCMPPTPIISMMMMIMINLKCCRSHRFTFSPHIIEGSKSKTQALEAYLLTESLRFRCLSPVFTYALLSVYFCVQLYVFIFKHLGDLKCPPCKGPHCKGLVPGLCWYWERESVDSLRVGIWWQELGHQGCALGRDDITLTCPLYQISLSYTSCHDAMLK